MINVINLFKNNLIRILQKKEIIIIALVVMPLMIGIAVLFSGNMESKAHIALVADNAQGLNGNDKIKIDVMKEMPAFSTLVLNKYSAIAEKEKDGTYKVTAIKSRALKEMIEGYLNGGKISVRSKTEGPKRGAGTNILGFIMMIVLMQGVALTMLFPEDSTLKTFRRVLTTPVSEKLYLFVQGIFTLLCLFIPTFLAVTITKICFSIEIGYSLGMMAVLIGILCILSTAFAILITSVLERNITLVASGIYIITSILAGGFYSFTDSNKTLDMICSVIPQREFMTLIQGIENGKGIFEFQGQLIYLLILIIASWLIGSIITRRKITNI